MEKYKLLNNSILNFIPIQAQVPIYGFRNFAGTGLGSINVSVPHTIVPDYVDFKYFYIENGIDWTIYNNPSGVESWLKDLFDVTDTFKVATLFNGLQFLKIPINRFNDITVNPIVKNYGTYYIKISPKYVDTTILNFNVTLNGLVLIVEKNPLRNSIWDLELIAQPNFLVGSVVEVWSSEMQKRKQTKIISEDNYPNIGGNANEFTLTLTPDTFMHESVAAAISTGDILRIYPKETYFTPIFIEVNYQSSDNDLEAAIRYLKNDTTRDLVNNIIEIYDDNGATVNAQGNIDGVVIQSYQISKIGTRELRKNLKI